jgi:hypothetical protein
MSAATIAICPTRDRLYDEYEKALLKRIAHGNSGFVLSKASKIQENSERMARALQQLREHERTHCCHYRSA